MTIQESKSGKTIVFIDKAFDADGFETSNNMGFLAYDTTKFATLALAIAKAKTIQWKLIEQLDGTFDVKRA